MSLSQRSIEIFQTRARAALGGLAGELNLELRQEDDLTFVLLGRAVEVRLYVYPSHIPCVNITLLPTGPQWDSWKAKSVWKTTGIFLQSLARYRKSDLAWPDTHFRNDREMCEHIDALAAKLRMVGRELLEGDSSLLPGLVAYVDT